MLTLLHVERDFKVSRLAIDAARLRLQGNKVELDAARKGLFVGDSYNDQPSSVQRAEEVDAQIADFSADIALRAVQIDRLQRDLAAKNLMLLHNHGTLAVGKTCAEAFLRMYFLERACTMQVRTRMLGGASSDHPTAAEVIEKNAALAHSGGMSTLAEKLVWPALLRKLDRVDQGFRN